MLTRIPAARAVDVWKTYGSGESQVTALRGINLELDRGAFTAIMGPAGSGKSTLMHCLAGLDPVTSGRVHVSDTVGFIFERSNLLPTLTAHENILLPLSIAGRRPDPAWYATVIDAVGLRDQLDHRPAQLSGGQQQRVACGRALISRPAVIFADEPTGNLDDRAAHQVLSLLRHSVTDLGQTIVMVTHDPDAASYADRVVYLADGSLVDELVC